MAAPAIVGSMAALVMLSLAPGFLLVLGAEVAQGACGVGLSLAVAALTLSVSRQERLGERFGATSVTPPSAPRWARLCLAPLEAGLGRQPRSCSRQRSACQRCWRSAASTPTTSPPPIGGGPPHGSAAARPPHACGTAARTAGRSAAAGTAGLRGLVPTCQCQPTASRGHRVARQAGSRADMVTAAAVIGPQLLAALLSPHVGMAAQLHGRRIILMLGLAAVPLRALAFAFSSAIPAMLDRATSRCLRTLLSSAH